MADKKFKSGVDLQSTVKISSATPEKALILNASGELVSSSVSDVELGYLDGVSSDLQTQLDNKISADGSVTTHNDVTDAGSGIIISGAERTKLDGIESGATADQSDAEIKTAYENNADTNAFTDAEQSKLGGIEASADVTDATNVAAAGATMDSDTSLAGNGYFLDEDNMASDSATKVPSQQSVKKYVDDEIASQVASAKSYQGGYDAATDSPSLDDGSPIAGILKGDAYDVTVAGNFFTVEVEVGDMMTARQDSPTLESHWVVVQANLTPSSIKSQYESNADTNEFSDAEQSKLAGIESGATADQSDAEIKTAYENNADTNAFTDAEKTLLGNQSGTNSGDEAAASTTVAGIAEVATVAEIDAQTDDTRMISPLGLAGSALQSKVDGIESGATADQTGAEIKSAYEGEADTNAFDDAAVSKLGGIEALADVTDAANVAAAGATMDSDSSLAGNSYFLDEDDMNSDDATKVPSQQSVKAYVDSQVGGVGSAGDISETSFAASNNVAAAADVTGLAFANGVVRSFKAQVSIEIDATADLYELYDLQGIQKGSGWDMSIESVGDESNIVFSITSAGQVQYTSGNEAGFVSNSIKFRADTTSV